MSNENMQGAKKFWNKNSVLVTMGLAVAVLGTSLWIMSTFSRNTSTVTGGDSGTVARFAYTIKQTEGTDQTLTADNSATLNIFDTAAEPGMASGKTIAPGMAGYFAFSFANESSAPVKTTFDSLGYSGTKTIDATTYQVPIIFYFNGLYYSDLYGQSLADFGQTGKTGANWIYYFNEGDSSSNTHGITLAGNVDALKTALNQFSANHEDTYASGNKATSFLSNSGATAQDYLKLAWFYPFDARLSDDQGSPVTTGDGSDPGSGFTVYTFDNYNGKFIDGSTTVSMTPVIRVSQIDQYLGNVHTGLGASNHGFYADGWFRPSSEIPSTAAWGLDPQEP